jgi:16S rRNA (guanine966-N2)-methyltransferase
VRVIAGELRGRRLASPPPEADVRPTPDRVREALFSIVAAEVPGALVLDLYCGTGALAIEALSRGAEKATLVDTDVTLAERNVAALGLEHRAEVVRADALDFLAGTKREWDLILCDPPYRLAARLQAPLEKLVPDRLAAGGRLVVESAERAPLALSLPVVRERAYGETRISIYGGSDG